MKKKLLSLLLGLVLILALLPAGLPGAAAAAAYPLWVGSTQVTDANKSNIPVAGGKAQYDPATGTLTLTQVTGVNGLHTVSGTGCMIYAEGIDLTVKGSAVLTDRSAACGILVSGGSLTVRAKLELDSGTSAVRCGDLVLSGCAIVFPGDARIYAGQIYSGTGAPAPAVKISPIPPIFLAHPAGVSAVPGQTVSFRVLAAGIDLKYQWQSSADSGRTWSAVSGQTRNTLTFTATEGNIGTRYRCRVSNSAGTVTSSSAALSPANPPIIEEQPEDVSGKLKESVSFRVKASGSGLSYQWQYSRNDGASWVSWSGKTASLLTTTATVNNNGYLYRCRVTNAGGFALTNEVRLTVTDARPAILVQPVGLTVAEDGTAVFRLTCAGTQLSWQWQSSADGGTTWSDLSGTNAAQLPVIGSSANNGTLYRCRVTNPFGSVLSAAVKLTVMLKPPKPTITAQPEDASVKLGQTVTFRVTASGSGLSYQWYYSLNAGSSWTAWSGKTSASLTVTGKTSNDGCLYRCEVRNSSGSVVSRAAKLTVISTGVSVVTQPQDAAALIGNSVTFTVSAQGTGLSYQWEYSKNDGAKWYTWSGKTSPSLETTVKATNNGCLYRCLVKGSDGYVYSRAARLTAKNSPPTVLVQPQDVTAPLGSAVTMHVTAWGTDVKYQWYYSTDNGANFQIWNGKTSPDLELTAKTSNNGCLYRCYLVNVFGVQTSASARLTVN
ncbi:MAG: immunoglobulin domain-containing protein [Oscillospiraceae bacterium]|nr:immunoglobulin domain-containing protein [Oscillospiraceae bacterium]